MEERLKIVADSLNSQSPNDVLAGQPPSPTRWPAPRARRWPSGRPRPAPGPDDGTPEHRDLAGSAPRTTRAWGSALALDGPQRTRKTRSTRYTARDNSQRARRLARTQETTPTKGHEANDRQRTPEGTPDQQDKDARSAEIRAARFERERQEQALRAQMAELEAQRAALDERQRAFEAQKAAAEQQQRDWAEAEATRRSIAEQGHTSARQTRNATVYADLSQPQFLPEASAFEAEMEADATSTATAPPHILDFDSDPGMLKLSYPRDTPRESRPKLSPLAVAGGYTAAAVGVEGVPPMQTDGINPPNASRGPFTLYMPYSACVRFCDSVTEISVEAEPGEDQRGGTVQLVPAAFKVFAAEQVNRPMDLPDSFLDSDCAWVQVFLPNGADFTFVHTDDVKKALLTAGCHTYKSARKQLTMDTEDGKVRLGKEFRTGLINVTCKPIGADVATFGWPKLLEGVTQKGGHHFALKYKLGGPGTDRLCADELGCKMPKNRCKCAGEGSSMEPRVGERRPREEAETRATQSTSAQSAFLASYVPTAKKHQVPCPHLFKNGRGMCISGSKCGYMHVGDAEEWAQIPCGRPRTSSGACDAWPNCVYKGCPKPATCTRRPELRVP